MHFYAYFKTGILIDTSLTLHCEPLISLRHAGQ